jgi:hypothetical protein
MGIVSSGLCWFGGELQACKVSDALDVALLDHAGEITAGAPWTIARQARYSMDFSRAAAGASKREAQ